MGLYRSRLFPPIIHRFMADESFGAVRGNLLSGARGRVLEIGFGIGLNLQFEEAGFAIDAIDNFYMERMPRIGGYLYVGVATEVFGL
jgi:hypothetical protein